MASNLAFTTEPTYIKKDLNETDNALRKQPQRVKYVAVTWA